MSNEIITGPANLFAWNEDYASWRHIGATDSGLPIPTDFGGDRVMPDWNKGITEDEWNEFVKTVGLE